MRSIRSGLVIAMSLAALGSANCATGVPVAKEKLLRRAAFDLSCTRQQLTITTIDEDVRAVDGCGRQATYVQVCDGPVSEVSRTCNWLMNGRAPSDGQ
jgi:hypothetical protein